jgi:hypothetical protein
MLRFMDTRRAILIVITVAVNLTASAAWAQRRPVPKDFSYPAGSQTIQIEIKTGALSGIVTDPNGGALSDVLVEQMGANWTNRSAAAFTNSRGRFRFTRLPNGAYYLKLSKPGFSDLKVMVHLTNGSKPKLHLKLPLGI